MKKKGGDVEFWVAVAALLVAVWAVVQGASAKSTRDFARTVGQDMDLLDGRLRALEERVGQFERRLVFADEIMANLHPDAPPWPPLLRAGGDKPTIRNVRTPDGEE